MDVHKQMATDEKSDERWIEIKCKGPWVRVHSSFTAYSPDWTKVTCRRCKLKKPRVKE